MRLNEFESSQPEVGDILEIEIGNELVETVIVGIHRGNYIVESTSTNLLESKLNEVDPRNYDSDIDYYNALRATPKRAQEPDDLPEPVRPYTDKDAEDDISQQRQRADAKFRQKRKVEYVDQEGSAPNGQKHNKLYVIDAQDEATARHEEYLFDKHEWGAKKVVDTNLEKNNDGSVRLTLYIVDNHKYGLWRPWKDSPVYKEGTEQGVAEGLNERAEKKEKVKVYVKNPKTGRVVKVDFGEPGQLIKKSKKHRKHGKKRWNLKK